MSCSLNSQRLEFRWASLVAQMVKNLPAWLRVIRSVHKEKLKQNSNPSLKNVSKPKQGLNFASKSAQNSKGLLEKKLFSWRRKWKDRRKVDELRHRKSRSNNLKLFFFFFPSLTTSNKIVIKKKKICLQCRRPGFDPWVRKILWRREWQPTPVFLPGKSHGQKSLVGYSPQGHKQLDMTEWLTHTHIHRIQVAHNTCGKRKEGTSTRSHSYSVTEVGLKYRSPGCF